MALDGKWESASEGPGSNQAVVSVQKYYIFSFIVTLTYREYLSVALYE